MMTVRHGFVYDYPLGIPRRCQNLASTSRALFFAVNGFTGGEGGDTPVCGEDPSFEKHLLTYNAYNTF